MIETPKFTDRLQNAWNAFIDADRRDQYRYYENITSFKPDRAKFSVSNERTIVNAIYNRIALDVATLDFHHVRLDDGDRFKEYMDSGLNYCLSVQANRDQTARAFIQDVVMSLFDEGSVAILPVDVSTNSKTNPEESPSFNILTMRTGKILEWMPNYVKVRAYNDRTGNREDIVVSKDVVAIIENPFYSVMNEHNSIMKRLIRKLNLVDTIDEQIGSNKMDLIISLPYTVKTESKRTLAEKRRKDIEMQLSSSNYGIAYVDGTERITQLNRPIENNMTNQVEYLTELAFSQLNITKEILNGTADEKTMRNYYARVIGPVASAIVEAMSVAFLTRTARTQKQAIIFFNDPFKLVPVSDLAELADKLTRNEIMTSNEIRQIIGLKPSTDPEADELRNKNLNRSNEETKTEQLPPSREEDSK